MPGGRILKSAGRRKAKEKDKKTPKAKKIQAAKSVVQGTKSLFAAKSTYYDDTFVEDFNVYEEFVHKVRWIMPQDLSQMTFIGREVVAVAQDCYISFLSLRTMFEKVYVANSTATGDGVDVLAGYKASNMFVFAEQVEHARIFVVNYPSFEIAAELKDHEVNRYKALCMMEQDLIAGFTGFPGYFITVWSWRVNQRIMIIPTNVLRRDQIYMSSRSAMLVAQSWGEGLIVWEVGQCFKKSFMLKRMRPEETGWEIADPVLTDICWIHDGSLFAVDGRGRLFSMNSDGISMKPELEWSDDEIEGEHKTHVCAFLTGILMFGPDENLRSLKLNEKKWQSVWMLRFEDDIERLISNAYNDVALAWTTTGRLYRIIGDTEETVEVTLVAFKQRNIKQVAMIAPNFSHMATIDYEGAICIYDMCTGNIAVMKFITGHDLSMFTSPVDPLIIVTGEVGPNYGMILLAYDPEERSLERVRHVCLTHQIICKVLFSETGRHLAVAAMSAGHVFVYTLSKAPEYELTLQRYSEGSRGLADICLQEISKAMKCFMLVLFSDKYLIGERIDCINVETGKDNKVAGRMMGPYTRLVPLTGKDALMAIPHLSRQYHILLMTQKGLTLSVRMGPIIDSGHNIKSFNAYYKSTSMLLYAYDGVLKVCPPDGTPDALVELNLVHRYEGGYRQALVDYKRDTIVTFSRGGLIVVHYIHDVVRIKDAPRLRRNLEVSLIEKPDNEITLMSALDKNHLDMLEEKKVKEEAMDYKTQREDIVKNFIQIQKKLVYLLEENIGEVPLHQLSLSEFNLHAEKKRERLSQAEREREEIRLTTEALIKAQDKVTAWIKKTCWDSVSTPRVKLLAIFSHYQVENYAVLPTQRDKWPELTQVEAIRTKEMENDADLFKPWEEIIYKEPSKTVVKSITAVKSSISGAEMKAPSTTTGSMMEQAQHQEEIEETEEGEPYALSGTMTHKYVKVPDFMIHQLLAFSFLQMNWLYEIVKLNIQHIRLWFNKLFDELMNQKKREVGMVEERNARLRFILDELNKLSDLRLSFHHFMIGIADPVWAQTEQPIRLTKVDPEECSIEPYISPSQIVIIPPDPGPKDDFKERALNEMMDGVLEKLWHEEIKKPIPKPACMLEKEPENFTEEDLRAVFDWEARVKFREEEREKYRKMLHAEYKKLSDVLNEGIVKFNLKVKDLWLTKLTTDSVIGQENLNLMRLRRFNLDRIEMSEAIEDIRTKLTRDSNEMDVIQMELKLIQEQGKVCQAAYEALFVRDKQIDKSFRGAFADLSPVILDTTTKFYKKRPKWHQRVTMTPAVLYELASSIATGVKSPMLHPDVQEFFRQCEQQDSVNNMPSVLDEGLWNSMCKLRRNKIENETKMRAHIQEMAYIESAVVAWTKATCAYKDAIAATNEKLTSNRIKVEKETMNRTVQIVLPAGQVEIVPTGHFEDFDDAALIRKEEIDAINDLILRVGAIKLRLMRRMIAFRKVILMKEWEHAGLKLKLKHMEQELYTYHRLKIPKELQRFLKEREEGYDDARDFELMEKEMEATKKDINMEMQNAIKNVEDMTLKIAELKVADKATEKLIQNLIVECSEKRLIEDPLKPIKIRKVYKERMDIIVERCNLIRQVQDNHSTIVQLQTELELLRLKTYPTLASFKTID